MITIKEGASSMNELRITRFWIKNFKSLKDVSIELRKFNLLVGPNASGKTNIIEAFKLFSKIISPGSKYINPFLEWWGYQNVVWRGKEELPIILGFEAKIGDYRGIYEIYITGIGGEFRILREAISIPGIVEVIREGSNVMVKHDPNFIESIWDLVKDTIKLSKEQILVQRVATEVDKTEPLFRSWSARYIGKVCVVVPRSLGPFPDLLRQESYLKVLSPVVSTTEIRFGRVFQHNLPLISAIAPPIRQHDIIILRQLTFKAIRTPQPFKREILLAEDGSNLANVFHSLYTERGGVPDRIRAAINAVFGESVSVRPEVTEDGRIYLKVFENDLELRPTMVADGLWKILTVMIAIERKPRLLIIDELENSLHPEAIEYVVNELRSSESIVIVTTHSPAVVDAAKPEDLILVEKDVEGNTITRRISEPEKVKAWLTKHGITLSEGWLYGEIFSGS